MKGIKRFTKVTVAILLIILLLVLFLPSRTPQIDGENSVASIEKVEIGGVERQVNTLKDIIFASIFSPEYTGIDGIKLALGSKFTSDTMWGQNYDLNFIRDLPEVKVPIYFCVGRYDYNTPSVLVEDYYNQLVAPKKDIIWFEESAHFPHFEEPDKFAQLMVQIKEDNEQ